MSAAGRTRREQPAVHAEDHVARGGGGDQAGEVAQGKSPGTRPPFPEVGSCLCPPPREPMFPYLGSRSMWMLL
eukprot:9048296-Pyramimonas_sp.AAC.1